MQVTETHSEGLKREFRIVIAAGDLNEQLETRIEAMKPQAHIKGFRPGKVPASFLKKTYGKSIMGELVQTAVTNAAQTALSERELRPALQPAIELEGEIDRVIEGESDLAFTVAVELLPEIQIMDLKGVTLERPMAEVEDETVMTALKRLADQQKSYEPKGEGAIAESGDAVTIDFVGKLGDEPFEGGKGEDVRLVLGSGQFIPGFEDQLIGVKAGDTPVVKLSFPDDYQSDMLKGKDATFDVTVRDVLLARDVALDDEFAKRFGIDSLDKLKDALREQAGAEYKKASRTKMKRALLDILDEGHTFALPTGLVDAEFEGIWHEVEHAHEHGHPSPEDEGRSQEDLRVEYRKIAERRVRLGLVLAEIGRENKIILGQEELGRAIAEQARQYPGQERQVYEYFQKNPQALPQLRAPLLEDKVVDFLIELANVTDKTVSVEELMREPSTEFGGHAHHHDHDHDHDHGGHVHGPDCDHDHGADAAAAEKPKRKPRAKKAKPEADDAAGA